MKHPVILFDGICNLCQSSVQFIVNRDPSSKFRFASLQSEIGKSLLVEHGFPPTGFYSIILINSNSKVYIKSGAALRIARQLNGLWPLLSIFLLIPSFLRNMVYDWIARNRYRWFGKKDECMVPSPELKFRFL